VRTSSGESSADGARPAKLGRKGSCAQKGIEIHVNSPQHKAAVEKHKAKLKWVIEGAGDNSTT
jgi:hypothetical protein